MKNKNIADLFFCKGTDFLEVFIPKQSNGSDNTKKTYKASMTAFRRYVNQVKGIPTNKFYFSDCTYDFLLDYRNYLHDNLGLKETTANNRLAAIKSYVNYAAARDLNVQQFAFAVHQVPFYPEPHIQQPIVENSDALSAMLSIPPNTKKGLRDKVIMAVLFDGGIRLSEMLSLTIGNLQINEKDISMHIHGKRKKERTDVMSEKTSALIMQYLTEYHPCLKPEIPFIYTITKGHIGKMTARNVQALMKKYADKARKQGYELPKSVSPHTLRRTRGTYLYRDGVPIETIAIKLGHADTQTTRKHYTSPSNDQLREIANRKNEAIPDEEPLWTDDEDEMGRILGF